MQDIVIPIGNAIDWSFGILEALQNLPNMLFLGLGFVGLAIWLRLQTKFNKEAANNTDQIK